MLNLITSLIALIALIVILYEQKTRDPHPPSPPSLERSQDEQKGCKELDALSAKERKRKLKYDTPRQACIILFFKTNKIKDPAAFLGPNRFKTYKRSLEKNECLKAEQILWQQYKTTYRGTPNVDFSKTDDNPKRRWRFYVLSLQVPEVYFCIYKKRFETNQKKIRKNQLSTIQITDLFKIYEIKGVNELEGERNHSLKKIVHLMKEDYAPAQIYILQLSMNHDIFQLLPREQYRLLKRLEMLGNLPESLNGEFEKARQNITEHEAKAIDDRLARHSFFLITTMPTMASEKK